MRFLLDNMISYRIARALRELGRDVWGLREKFSEDASDVQWITELARQGNWAFVSVDRRIRSRPHERAVLSRANVTAFFLGAFFYKMITMRDFWPQAVWIIRRWPNMAEAARLFVPGTCLSVQYNGRIAALPPV